MACFLAVVLCLVAAVNGQTDPPPLVRGDDPVARLLNEWDQAGRAAGHEGVTYDNRDNSHSSLNLNRWPRLTVFLYNEADKQANRHMGPAGEIRPGIVIGNASMSAAPHQGGSLPRMYYTQPEGLRFLEAQYFSNNVFVYPEHRDHDPGLGDLYPTNTPYLIISQGSSGSDQPFMEAWTATVAAFRPEVRDALAQPGVLMPIMQYLFRRNLAGVESDEDYLSGRAHPVVFEGDWVDTERMVRMAQEMDMTRVPAIVRLKIEEETKPQPNRDFFEPARFQDEALATQMSLIARIWRGTGGTREMLVSAAESVDPNSQPLTYRWVLLQGDPSKVSITPLGLGDRARITWQWQGQRPSGVFPDRSSGRVDIGVFAFNGRTWSPPAMITWWHDPRELRAYDTEGRILEVWYDAPNQDAGLPVATDPAWLNFLAKTAEGGSLGRELLRGECSYEQWDALERAWDRFGEAAGKALESRSRVQEQLREVEERRTSLRQELDRNKRDGGTAGTLEEALEHLQQEHKNATKSLDDAHQHWGRLGADAVHWFDDPENGADGLTVRQILQSALFGMMHRSDLEPRFGERLSAEIRLGRGGPVQDSRLRMEKFGLLQRQGGRWLPPADLADRPGAVMEHFHLHHLTLLRESVLADVLRPTGPAPIHDLRLTGRRNWRDIYQYDPDGQLLGWVRWHSDRKERFDAEGRILGEHGAMPVIYRENRPGEPLEAVSIP